MGRPVQSGRYPHTKIFIEIDSLYATVDDKKGRVSYDGLILSRYDHVLTLGGVKFQVITISPSTEIVDIALEIMIHLPSLLFFLVCVALLLIYIAKICVLYSGIH